MYIYKKYFKTYCKGIKCSSNINKLWKQPWPVRLSGLGIILQSERSLVWFPVRSCAWVAGSVPVWGTYEKQSIDVSLSYRCFSPSLSPSLPLSPKTKEIKSFLKNKLWKQTWTAGLLWEARALQQCEQVFTSPNDCVPNWLQGSYIFFFFH